MFTLEQQFNNARDMTASSYRPISENGKFMYTKFRVRMVLVMVEL